MADDNLHLVENTQSDSDDGANVYNIGGKKKTKKRRGSLSSIKNFFIKRTSKESENNNKMNVSSSGDVTFGDYERDNSGRVAINSVLVPVSVNTYNAPPQKYTVSENILNARVPTFYNMDLGTLQVSLNYYFQNTLNDSFNAYELTHSPGDRAVGYFFYSRYLISEKVGNTPEVFKMLIKIMYQMYENWSFQTKSLYPLVVNLNGADPTKEIMNIVNQSVYSVVRFIMKNVLGKTIPLLFTDLNYRLTDPIPENCERAWYKYYYKLISDQAQLSCSYNNIISRISVAAKFYHFDEETPYKILSDVKLIAAPVPASPKFNFTIIK
nr:unknown [Pieris rapae granulovirus]